MPNNIAKETPSNAGLWHFEVYRDEWIWSPATS